MANEKVSAEGSSAAKKSLEDILLLQPLYSTVPVEPNVETTTQLRFLTFQLDAYCVQCGRPSTFHAYRSRRTEVLAAEALQPGFFSVELSCTRTSSHRYIYWFRVDRGLLTKVGQWPSMEDVAGADIERFRPVLKKGMFQELRKAGGLASHGVGIGSYAYLRRIFESLIDQHRTEVEETCGPIAGFDKMRMGEKIGALADVLPQALVRNKAAYAILSKGIHELSEDECLRYFPMLKAAIVLILDQDLREKQRRDAEALLEAEITRIASELGNETTSAEAGDTG